ncbi:Vomeronasal type-1 receptor A8 [Sciurus carolinensis]|uniref:Vomeronasal type-1 receptor n=1 Tax=Sciurus carolinensis TaxID=30640 RepID=A0AA41N718_SCICA|nr:Vomeronasal type-1 receptor A8 [Sciurus carolinensis]
MNKDNKLYSDTHIRNTLYIEIDIGILANIILLLFHVSFYITGHQPKPTDLPIGLLALIYLIMLLIKDFIDADIYTPWGEDGVT